MVPATIDWGPVEVPLLALWAVGLRQPPMPRWHSHPCSVHSVLWGCSHAHAKEGPPAKTEGTTLTIQAVSWSQKRLLKHRTQGVPFSALLSEEKNTAVH